MHWTVQLSGRTDVDVEQADDGQVRITQRHSQREAKKHESELIDRLRTVVRELDCDFARLNTAYHGTIDLI